MEKREGEGEELCEIAAVHLAPNISSLLTGWELQLQEGEQFAVWERLQQVMSGAAVAGRDGEWMQTLQRTGSQFALCFWVVLYELLNTTESAQLIIDSCRPWM